MEHWISLRPDIAQRVAQAIFDNIDKWGVEEIKNIRSLLSGNISIEGYLKSGDVNEDEES